MKKIVNITIILLLQPIFSLIFAQSNVKTLDECITIALEENLSIKVNRLSVEKSKNLQGTAFNIGKTGLSLGQDLTSGGNPDNSITINQEFEFPSLYVTRYRMLKAETQLAKSQLHLTEQLLIKEISELYYHLLCEKEIIKILQQQDSLYHTFLFLATAKYQSGDASQLEQIYAERVCKENTIALQNALQEYQNLLLQLQILINSPQIVEPKEDYLPQLKENADKNNLSSSPILSLSEQQQRVSQKQYSLQGQKFIPEFNFSLGNQLMLPHVNPYHVAREKFTQGDFLYFEVGLKIPLFFGEQLAVTKAAKKEVEIAKIDHNITFQQLKNKQMIALNEHLQLQKNVDYYNITGKEQATTIIKLSQLSYENGEINYIEYAQNMKSAFDIYLQCAYTLDKYNQNIILLNYLGN